MEFAKTLTLKDIKELYSDNSSCIKKVSSNFTLLLHPMHVKTIQKGVKNELNSMSNIYIREFRGVLMGYEHLKVLSAAGWLFETNPHLHIIIKADFYIFSPGIGDVLKGTVVKKSKNVIGCLVHNIFNASSTIPLKLVGNQWCGSRVSEGDTLQIKITKLDLMSPVPYIRGEIVPESISKMASGLHDQQQPGTNPSHRIVFNDDDSGISSVDKSFDEDIPLKKKKKKKASKEMDGIAPSPGVEDQEQVEAKEYGGGVITSSPKLKKKEVVEPFVKAETSNTEEQRTLVGKRSQEKMKMKKIVSEEQPNFHLKEEPQSEVEFSPKNKKRKRKMDDLNISSPIAKKIKRDRSDELEIERHKSKKLKF